MKLNLGPIHFTTDAHPLGQAFSPNADKTNSLKEQLGVGKGGGGSGAKTEPGGWSGNFHADDLINQHFTDLTDQQREYIRNQLNAQGLNEKSKPADFIKGLQSLAQGIPGLQAKAATNTLFPQQGAQAGGWDPLAQQLFFSQVLGPALSQIQSQTQSITNPLMHQAQAALKGVPNSGGLSAMMSAMQGGEANLQGALGASAITTPGLDQLMNNVTQARQAAQRAYYEAERAAVYGSGGAGAGQDLSGLIAAIQGNKTGG